MKGITMLVLLMSTLFFAYADDQVTIATYFPSPYASYRNLQLYPSSQPTAGFQSGTLYYNQSTNYILSYNGSAWNEVGKWGTEISTYAFLRNYNTLCPNTFPNTMGQLTAIISACNRRCGAGCSVGIGNCNGVQPGLGYRGGTAVEWDNSVVVCECI